MSPGVVARRFAVQRFVRRLGGSRNAILFETFIDPS